MTLAVESHRALYETDYLQWLEVAAERLRDRDYAAVDWENLIEEIEDMRRREQRSLKRNLIVLLLHLLKWQYQPDCRSGSWESSIIEHRFRIQEALQDSPSLKPYLEEIFDSCYPYAAKRARAETGLPKEVFPEICPYEMEEVLAEDFLP